MMSSNRNAQRSTRSHALEPNASTSQNRISSPSATGRVSAAQGAEASRAATHRSAARVSAGANANPSTQSGRVGAASRASQGSRDAASSGKPGRETSRREGQQTAAARRANNTGKRGSKDANPSKSRYIPALDGLRALAVLAVIAYHMGMPWAQGGLLGVTVFFVLSGYLITSLLIAEYERTGRIDLPQFWLRRVRRLVPAIVTVILFTAALCTLFSHEILTKMRSDIIPSLFFFNNWWQIFHDVSYFEALGSPSPLTHFWSLAIEEQFYLVWPVLLLVAFKLGAKRTWVRRGVLILAALSALEMALLFDPAADPSRVYYGTDTRVFSLLIGVWLAFAWPSAQLGSKRAHAVEPGVQHALDAAGAVALIALIAQMALMNGFTAAPYRGGILLCSMLTAVAIAVMVHPASLLGRVFGCAPLVWIGKRSYSIYLWHYPLLLLMNPRNNVSDPAWWMLLIQLAVIVAAASLCYRFVENPIRHGAFGRMAGELACRETTLSELVRKHIAYIVGTVLVAGIAIGGIALVPDTSSVQAGAMYQEGEQQNAAAEGSEAEGTQGAGPEEEAAAFEEPADIVMIGDSVSVRTIPYFQETFPDGIIDAAVNRQVAAGVEVLTWYLDQGAVGDVVVFALGTNGMSTADTLDSLMEKVGSDREVFFVNTRCPQLWEQNMNSLIADTCSRYDNAHLIDWYAVSADHDEYFDGDGTHLTEYGAQTYINMIDVATYITLKPLPSLFGNSEDTQQTDAQQTE